MKSLSRWCITAFNSTSSAISLGNQAMSSMHMFCWEECIWVGTLSTENLALYLLKSCRSFSKLMLLLILPFPQFNVLLKNWHLHSPLIILRHFIIVDECNIGAILKSFRKEHWVVWSKDSWTSSAKSHETVSWSLLCVGEITKITNYVDFIILFILKDGPIL